MKNLIKIFCVLLIGSMGFNTATAQTRADKKAAKAASITKLIEDKNYVFVADYVSPTRGAGHALTSEYDLTIAKDSVIAYLPYFGRAYLADYGSTDEGIKFSWTKFDYKVTPDKKGDFEILITPVEKNIGDAKAVQSIRLRISPDGYASLQVTSFNREPISFNGSIESRVKPKVQSAL
jgi:Domain of unknown function (DUF4251)